VSSRVFQVGADVDGFRSAVLDVDDEMARAWCSRVLPGGRTFLDGSVLGDHWDAPALTWFDASGAIGDAVDVALFGGALVISQHAVEQLEGELDDCELLPASIEGSGWTVVNPTRLLDCVDPALSEYYSFPEDDGTPALRNPGFELGGDVVPGLFRIPQQRMRVLCASAGEPSQGFREVVLASGLSGFKFVEMRTQMSSGATGGATLPFSQT
jgi:hypothetical protein